LGAAGLVLCGQSASAFGQQVAAQPTQDELAARRSEAETRYEQGAAAYREKRYKDAIDLFLEADVLAPSSALSFNIARAYEKIGDAKNALRWYRDYLRRQPDAEDEDEVARTIEKYEAALSAKGVQQITVLSEPAGATLRVDRRPVGVTPWTGELAPGTHELELSLRGYADTQRSIELLADKSQDARFRLVPRAAAPATVPENAIGAPPAAPALAPSRNDHAVVASSKVQPATYIVLGAGAATLAAAGAFELARRSAESDARNEDIQVDYADALERMQRYQTTARVVGGVGAAILITGGVLLVLDLSRSKSVSVGGACVVPGCWVTARGSF
jgi:tetratricopeptide (TPR) repeat protein